MAERDTIRFAVISDTQRWYDLTHTLVDHLNGIAKELRIDFVLHCGDLTDFGAEKEYEWMRRELERLQLPYVCLLGNHDCLGRGQRVFEQMFGPVDFSFNASFVHFVCLNTNGLEFANYIPVPNLEFMERDASNVPYGSTCTVMVMHTAPGTDQFREDQLIPFAQHVWRFPHPLFGLCGHNHRTMEMHPEHQHLTYYQVGCAKNRQFYLFTLTREGGVEHEVLEF